MFLLATLMQIHWCIIHVAYDFCSKSCLRSWFILQYSKKVFKKDFVMCDELRISLKEIKSYISNLSLMWRLLKWRKIRDMFKFQKWLLLHVDLWVSWSKVVVNNTCSETPVQSLWLAVRGVWCSDIGVSWSHTNDPLMPASELRKH